MGSVGLARLKFGPYLDTQALYLVTYNAGRLYRLSYSGDVNRKPKPVIRKFLSSNGNGLTVDFDGSESSDPDGDEVYFEWNFGEEGSTSSGERTASYTYSFTGKFIATLTVTDGKGSKAATSVEIHVEEYPKPLVAFPWSSGEGEACDDDDQNYDYCGSLEFCTDGDVHGYRLTGEEECAPRLSPVIRVTPGKKYKFTLTNMAPSGNPTNIHTHGLHISGSGDADDVTRIVHGGNCLDYSKLLFYSVIVSFFVLSFSR
jgi:PKD repeat protein